MMTIQEQKVLERMKHVLLHLRECADSGSIDDETGRNVDALLALGALSPGKDVPALETELTTCHLIGTTAGAVIERRK